MAPTAEAQAQARPVHSAVLRALRQPTVEVTEAVRQLQVASSRHAAEARPEVLAGPLESLEPLVLAQAKGPLAGSQARPDLTTQSTVVGRVARVFTLLQTLQSCVALDHQLPDGGSDEAARCWLARLESDERGVRRSAQCLSE